MSFYFSMKQFPLIAIVGYTVLTLAIVFLFITYLLGINSVLSWGILSELGEVPFQLDRLTLKDISLQLNVPAYYITEQFVALPMQIANWVWYISVVLILLGFTSIEAAISSLTGWRYYLAMMLLAMMLFSWQLDSLWGLTTPYISICIIFLYGGINYYFQAFRTDISLLIRWAVFATITLISILISIYLQKPIIYSLMSYSLSTAILVSIVFIFWISIEIIRGILRLTTAQKSSQSLFHFSILSLIYLGNILLTVLHNMKIIDWNILYISPFLLIAVSVLLGLEGLPLRTERISQWFNTNDAPMLLYIGCAIMSLACMAFAFGSANDPLIEAYEDYIVYVHLAMGITGWFYVFLNFGQLFRQGLAIYKIFYKPKLVALAFVQLAAFLIIILSFQQANFIPLNRLLASIQNTLGDFYMVQQDYKTAEVYYKRGLDFSFFNQKSNYALGSLALIQGDNTTAGNYFRQALSNNATPYTYSALGRCLQQEDLFFDALFTLREGIKRFPESGELYNNLAYLYVKSKVNDSAFYYYQQAQNFSKRPEIPQTNLLALNLKLGQKLNADSLNPQVYVSYEANRLAAQLVHRATNTTPTPFINTLKTDSVLSVNQLAYWANRGAIQKGKEPQLIPIAQKLMAQEQNSAFYDELQYISAIQDYYGGYKLNAIESLKQRTQADTAARLQQGTLTFWLKKETIEDLRLTDFSALNTPDAFENTLKRHPFNTWFLTKYVAYFNQKKQPKKGYDVLYKLLSFEPVPIEIKELYILQCLEMHLKDYAEEALMNLPPTDYQQFLPQYEAKLALIEKEKQAF
jgi:tetratricopeptide (TPR) repeat protein